MKAGTFGKITMTTTVMEKVAILLVDGLHCWSLLQVRLIEEVASAIHVFHSQVWQIFMSNDKLIGRDSPAVLLEKLQVNRMLLP